jgi:hypothetical protein
VLMHLIIVFMLYLLLCSSYDLHHKCVFFDYILKIIDYENNGDAFDSVIYYTTLSVSEK